MKLVALVLALVACGNSHDHMMAMPDGPKVFEDAPGPFMTAPHTPLPQAIPHAGVVLAHPQLVTLYYSDYKYKTEVQAWGDAVVTSSWWTKIGAEYGIGTMTHDAKFDMGPSPTTTTEDTDLETKIDSLITAGSIPAPPQTGSQYLYMIYVPSTVPLGNSLQGFYGYHYALTHTGGARYAYAVILDDDTGIDTTTSTAAHELIEAATDPFSAPNDGWYTDPALPDPWYLILGEVGDLCNFDPFEHEAGFVYQRSWSNAAAAAGLNPCIPNEDDVYESVTADPPTMPHAAKGSTVTFTLTGWSTQEEPDWTIGTYDADYSDLSSQQMTPMLSTTTINNGRTATLTFKVPLNAQTGKLGGVYVLSGPYSRPWAVGFIVQ
jgi:hypothetical protein